MVYTRDKRTDWKGSFEVKQFAIRATSPENIFTTNTLLSFEVTPQDPTNKNGCYIVKFNSVLGPGTSIGMAMVDCEKNIRVLQIVEITDNTQRQWTAIEVIDDKVKSFNQIATETGPATTDDRAWISVNNGKRI